MTIPIGSSTLAVVRDEKLQDRHASRSGRISCPMTEFGHPPSTGALPVSVGLTRKVQYRRASLAQET